MPRDKERLRAWARKRYHQRKLEDPEAWEERQQKQRIISAAWHKKKLAEDPKWVKENQRYQREYRQQKRIEDPDKVNREWREFSDKKRAEDPDWQRGRDLQSLESAKQRRIRDPHKMSRYSRVKRLKKLGITHEDFDAMVAVQDGRCAICNEKQPKQEDGRQFHLCVDHCHKTGKVRGLLCRTCNTGIGQLRDDPILVKNALDYLLR